jgi:hypothetical protein
MITVQVWRGEFAIGSAGEIASSTMYPKTRMDTAHDVIELSGLRRPVLVSVLQDSRFISVAKWHSKDPDIRKL